MATDQTRTVVALARLKVSRALLRHEWGSVTDLRAAPVAQSSPNVVGVVVLVVLVVVGALGLCAAGAPLLVVFFLAALALGIGLAVALAKAVPGEVTAPDLAKFPEIHQTLDAPEERRDFFDLIALAERAGRTLPSLESVIDPSEGGQSLAQALWEGADLLGRRQQLRPQMATLGRQSTSGSQAASRVAESLAEQKANSQRLWNETNQAFARLRTTIELAAVAGENAAYDQQAVGAARESYQELSKLYGQRS
ncbi:hypothetical protein [Micromonospora sp. CA-111912]|uniref:hypothetical protein n=1 Tax=Micromonospora sp. CA-111912 TaxID=3239955 RepID=UPI003D91D540